MLFLWTGTQFWRYNNENDEVFQQDPEGHRYPMLISKRFPGVSGPIDTAFYDRRDSFIYFFKNTLVRMVSLSSLWHMTNGEVQREPTWIIRLVRSDSCDSIKIVN